jgi:hypothetical protein
VSGHALAARSALTAAGLVALVGVVAAAVRLLGASSAARGALAFGFSASSATPGEAFAVALGNLRLAGAVLLAALFAGLRPAVRPALDIVVGALAGLNATTAGVALAAYGTRLLEAVAVHATLELAAFAIVGAAYHSARRGPLDGRQLMAVAAASTVLLAAAAVLETFVQIGASS